MGDLIVDDVRKILTEANIKPVCPDCGSGIFSVSYLTEYTVYLGSERVEMAAPEPVCISCHDCGVVIWQKPGTETIVGGPKGPG